MTSYWDVSWKQAACINEPKETFYPELGKQFTRTVLAAKDICNSCPIQLQCLEYGQANEEYGIWGGLTPEERKGKIRVYSLPKVQRVKRYEDKMVPLKQANQKRLEESATGNILKLQEAMQIATQSQVPAHAAEAMPAWLEAAQLRIDNPSLSISELAHMSGMSKDVYAGKLRRLIKFANESK